MSFAIIWMPEALDTFEDRINYLKIHFTEKEIRKFKVRVTRYLAILAAEPGIGKRTGRLKDVHIGLIIKQVSVIYRIKYDIQTIELLSFIDNRQNPLKTEKFK